MTVFSQLAKGASCILPSRCNEAIQNQYSGKNARVGKADGFLKKCGKTGRNRTVNYSFYFCFLPDTCLSLCLGSKCFLCFPYRSIY